MKAQPSMFCEFPMILNDESATNRCISADRVHLGIGMDCAASHRRATVARLGDEVCHRRRDPRMRDNSSTRSFSRLGSVIGRSHDRDHATSYSFSSHTVGCEAHLARITGRNPVANAVARGSIGRASQRLAQSTDWRSRRNCAGPLIWAIAQSDAIAADIRGLVLCSLDRGIVCLYEKEAFGSVPCGDGCNPVRYGLSGLGLRKLANRRPIGLDLDTPKSPLGRDSRIFRQCLGVSTLLLSASEIRELSAHIGAMGGDAGQRDRKLDNSAAAAVVGNSGWIRFDRREPLDFAYAPLQRGRAVDHSDNASSI